MLTKPKYSDLFAYDNIGKCSKEGGKHLPRMDKNFLPTLVVTRDGRGTFFFTGRGGEPSPPRGENFPQGGESNPGGNLNLRCFT